MNLKIYVAVAFLPVYYIIHLLYTRWQQRRKAAEAGCKPVRLYPHKGLFGYDLLERRRKAAQAYQASKLKLQLTRENGTTWAEKTWDTWLINTSEVENVQAVVATQFEDFEKPSQLTVAVKGFLGTGIFSLNGTSWKRARQNVIPLFKRAELQDIERFRKYVDRMFELIPRDGTTVNMLPLLQMLFLDSATEFVFGESVDTLRDGTGKAQRFQDAFSRSLGHVLRRLTAGSLFSLRYMFDKTEQNDISEVHAFVDSWIARSLARKESGESKGTNDARQGYVLIDSLSETIKDPVDLRFSLLQVFAPAREITGNAVANTLFMLARHPEVWTTLREQALDLGDQPLTFELIKSLHYFRYTIFESLRMIGPASRAERVAKRDTVLPRGGGPDYSAPIFVPKGTRVSLELTAAYHNPKLWGDDVEVFKPSRFQGKLITWEFTPFLGGPRICPANQQVLSQATYLLVRLAQEFESIENRDPCLEFMETPRINPTNKNGVQIALHPPSA